MARSRTTLALVALAVLAAAGSYGLVHEKLAVQPLWSAEGRSRLLVYALVYWTIAGLLLRFAPKWLAPATAIFVAIYTACWYTPAWSGIAALIAVLYFLGSCFFTGRILLRRADPATAVLLGMAVWMFAIWAALHFPVNTGTAYAIAFAIPYAWALKTRPSLAVAKQLDQAEPATQPEAAKQAQPVALAILLFVLLAHWLVALKPEISADGLSMHLALPMAVEHAGVWGFDFHRQTWSMMPAGGDCLFTAAYLLSGGGPIAGEAAARLLNFALLALVTWIVARASRSFLMAALFASTPLAHMVTGSLFVENVWAALILGGALALVRYEESGTQVRKSDLLTAATFLGAAMAVKLTAAVFVAPAALIGLWLADRRKQFRTLLQAAAVLAALAAPPYVYSFIKTGNPVFPFANTVFRSPFFDVSEPFADPRFAAPISSKTAYDITFRSGSYFEGQGGAAGFQYFLLLIPAALVIRRRSQWLLFGIAGVGTLVLFAFLPNLRYWYPALPLFSIVIAGLFEAWPKASIAVTALIGLNMWFWPAAGLYHRDFALFTHRQDADYLRAGAPQRALIERLNHDAPGEPVAFFSTDAVAGLNAPAYTDSWHTDEYWERVRKAHTPAEVAEVLRAFGIKHIVSSESGASPFTHIQTFLRRWIEPEDTSSIGNGIGGFGVFRLRDAALKAPAAVPFPPGVWDDLDAGIEYNGPWVQGRFAEALMDSLTYSDEPGDSLRLTFRGSAITYVFTKALNRGVALVTIDGAERARIDQYSAATEWQSQRSFDALGEGVHTFEVRVLGDKNARSSGAYVDLDGIAVR
jgi:hypothetical protein